MEKMIDFGSDLNTSYTQNLNELKKLMPFLFDLNGNLNLKAFESFVKEYKEIEPSKFEFTWSGKEKAQKLAFEEYTEGVLEADGKRGKNFHETSNIVIEGENLQVLHLLRKSYKGKVKCIYIDPPYNTGKDFVYNDKFELDIKSYLIESGQIDGETGEKLVDYITKDEGKRHSKWLSFMYPRLLIARDLLTEDGVVFVSIDDNEQANLKLMMTEIFGEENFVADLAWHKSFSPKNDAKHFSKSYENIICFAKDINTFQRLLLEREEAHNKDYKNPDNDSRGDWTSTSMLATTFNQKYVFSIKTPNNTEINPPAGRCWRYSDIKIQELINDNRIWFGENGNNVPRTKRFLAEVQQGIVPQTMLSHKDVGSGQDATIQLKKIFDGKQLFDYPKPVSLIKHILKMATKPGDLILDFFAGSGTTGQAVMELNHEEVKKQKEALKKQEANQNLLIKEEEEEQKPAGGRKFILVQLPEKINEKKEAYKAGYKKISDITIERVKRASEKYEGIDNGFKVFKLFENILENDDYYGDLANDYIVNSDSYILNLVSLFYGYGLNYKLKQFEFSNKIYEITSEFEERKALVILEENLLNQSIITNLINLSTQNINYTIFAKEKCLNIEIIYNLCNYFKKENIIRL